jgi:hypothetical protein
MAPADPVTEIIDTLTQKEFAIMCAFAICSRRSEKKLPERWILVIKRYATI